MKLNGLEWTLSWLCLVIVTEANRASLLSEDCNPRIPVPSPRNDPCEICRCVRGAINCRKRSCNHQPQDNCIGFIKRGECCPEYLCGPDRLKCNPKRIVFLPSSDPCEICRCKKGRINCRPKPCIAPPSENCLEVWSNKEQCCPDYDCDIDMTTPLSPE